jgi:hypothetical protein
MPGSLQHCIAAHYAAATRARLGECHVSLSPGAERRFTDGE